IPWFLLVIRVFPGRSPNHQMQQVVNTLFCCSSLLETMLVLFFAFHADEHVLPNWLAWLAPWVLCRRKISARTSIESTAGNIYRRLSQDCLDGKRKGRQTAAGERMKEIASSKLTETDTAKLIFFENLFYMLDSDSNGLITTEDVCSMLSFVNLSMEWTDLEIFLRSSWPADKLFNCSDFLEICVELMWTIPFQEIKMGAENYTSSCNRHIKRCQNHWQRWSKAIDRGSRFWLPLLYTTALGILLNLEFVDDYGSAGSVMFEGFGPIVVPPSGVVSALVTPTIGLISIVAWIYMKQLSHKLKQQHIHQPHQTERTIVPRWSMAPDVMDISKDDDISQDNDEYSRVLPGEVRVVNVDSDDDNGRLSL
ncbi:unnamed protein product, partial [Effrenium voratum]